MEKSSQSLILFAKKLLGNNFAVVAIYDLDIEESEYDSKNHVIKIGAKVFDDFRDEAIIAHEIGHYLQDQQGYWALRLCQWGILPGIFRYFVEENATFRALEIIAVNIQSEEFYWQCAEYLNAKLDNYLKQIFKWQKK